MAPFLPHRIMWFRRHKAIPSFSIPISLSSSSSFFLAIQTRWPGRQAITRLSRIQIDLYSGSIFNLGIVPRNCPKNNLLLSSPLLSLYLPRLSGPGGLCWYTSRRVNVWYVERIGGGGEYSRVSKVIPELPFQLSKGISRLIDAIGSFGTRSPSNPF